MARAGAIRAFADELIQRYGLDSLRLRETNAGDIVLDDIVVPASERGKGIGSSVMGDINAYADETGKRVTLTPAVAADAKGTTSKGRLVDFYKRHGYVENKGKGRDFEISEGMYRAPSSEPQSALRSLIAPATGAAVVGSTLAPEEAEAGVITKGGKRLIEAWHGSPHTFDKFDISKIGTGEGAQAYGHGLYFADSQNVAKEYRDSLSDWRPKNEAIVPGSTEDQAAAWLAEAFDAQSSNPFGRAKAHARNQLTPEAADEVEAVLNRWLESGEEFKKGNLYRTHIDVDPDTLLDYDKPLSEQPEGVRGVVADILGARPESPAYWSGTLGDDPTGGKVYRELDTGGGVLSRRLNAAGIPGIRYRDQMSRNAAPSLPDYDTWRGYNRGGAPDSPELRAEYSAEQQKAADFENNATYNYVMFDDKPISIVERGSANPNLLGTTAAVTGGALIAAPIAAAVTKFAESQNSKQAKWDEMKSKALQFANGAVDIMAQGDSIVRPGMPYINAALDAVDMPMQGLYGLTTVVSQLAAGSGFDQALQQGARVSQQPIDVTADEYAGPLADRGYPGTATALRTLMNVTGPI